MADTKAYDDVQVGSGLIQKTGMKDRIVFPVAGCYSADNGDGTV